MLTAENLVERLREGIMDIVIVGDLVEKLADDAKIEILEWQYICRDEQGDEVWDEADIFRGSIGELKNSRFVSGDFTRSITAHVVKKCRVDVTGTVQVNV